MSEDNQTASQPDHKQNPCFRCNSCYVIFPNKALYQEHIALNLVISCIVCKKNFCGHNKFREHEIECYKINPEKEENKDNVLTNMNKDWNTRTNKNTTDLELPYTTIMTHKNNVQQQSTNTQIETERETKLYSLPENVLPNFNMRQESRNLKNTFQAPKMDKGAEMDIIEIIGLSTINGNNLGLKPNNGQSSVNKMQTSKNMSDDISIKHIPVNIPTAETVHSLQSTSKIQTSPTKKYFPTSTTIIGISSHNLGLKPNNGKSSVNKMQTSKNMQEDIGITHIPVNIPTAETVHSLQCTSKIQTSPTKKYFPTTTAETIRSIQCTPKIKTSPTKKLFPTTTTKNYPNIIKQPLNFVKILPKPLEKESTIPKRQSQTTSNIGRDKSRGKGMPIHNFLVKSQNNFPDASNTINVGQTVIRPAYSVPQPVPKESYKVSKSAQYNIINKASPFIVQNVANLQRVPGNNVKTNYKQINIEHNVQAILRRKDLIPKSIASKQTLASTPILNLPINIRNVAMARRTGGTQKCIFLKTGNIESVPNKKPRTVYVKQQASIFNTVSNLSKTPRKSNQVQPQSKVLMKSTNDNIHVRAVNAANFNLTINPIQNLDKSSSNVLHTFNVPNTTKIVENGPNLRITATGTLIPTSNALSNAQKSFNEKNINTIDNKNELKEMLMDEHELDHLLLLAEQMKEASPKSPKTGLQNKPNLLQNFAPPKTNVDIPNRTLNENTIISEIKTEPLDEDMENNLRLLQETEDAITQSKSNNNCSDKHETTAYTTVPSDVTSVKQKIENIDCKESKHEKLHANENQDLTALENTTLLGKEKNRKHLLPISNPKPLTDPKENSGKDLKILPVPEVNKTIDVQNKITDSKISSPQNTQRSINENFSKEKFISQKSNDHGKSTVKQTLISTLIYDSDSDNYEVETLDEDLLESEELLRNGDKTECDQNVIEIFDDSDLSEVDLEILETVEDAVKSSGVYIKKPFKCQKCELAFCSNTSFSRHISSEHKRRFCFCKICNPTKENPNKISLISILEHKKNAKKNQAQNYIFYCEMCQQRFNNVISFKRHKLYCMMKQQKPENKFTKQYFNKTKDPRNQSLGIRNININHVKKVINKVYAPNNNSAQRQFGEKYQCTFCGNIYATLQTRLRHEAGYCRKNVNVLKAGLYPCEKCHKQFTTTMARKFHMKLYCYDKTQEMKFECKKCDRKFPFDRMLQYHQYRWHGHAYCCDYCQRSFGDKHHLTRHIIGHMGMKPFKCNICRQKFSRKCKLQVHLQRHSKKKDYACNICNKNFMFKNLLNRHMNVNCNDENIKNFPFLCDVCKKRYKNKKLIEKHIMNNHVKKFPCDICDKVFGQMFKLKAHHVAHGKKYFCNICKKRFLTKYHFMRHKANHVDYPCECGQKFNMRYDYYRHRTYWCPKTAGKPIDEIVKSDAILSKSNKKSTQTEFVKAKTKKCGSIKKIRKTKEDKVESHKNNKIYDEKRNVSGDKANITEQESTDSEDNYCLQQLATVKVENKISDKKNDENHEVIRDIKTILRKRKHCDNSSQDISKKTTKRNEQSKINTNKNSSPELFVSPIITNRCGTRNNETTNTHTITTRNKVYVKQEGPIKKNNKVASKTVKKNVAKRIP